MLRDLRDVLFIIISSSSFSSSLPITFIIAIVPLRHHHHPHPRWGSNCTETCSCSRGTTCHHVTGECLPCAPGIWGEGCKEECRWENLSRILPIAFACASLPIPRRPLALVETFLKLVISCSSCDEEGTELCGHTDGRCFCKGNRFVFGFKLLWPPAFNLSRFGLRCELLCPFGFINHTCLTQPIGSACQCPNDLYTCDLAIGCICPEGVDCGLEVTIIIIVIMIMLIVLGMTIIIITQVIDRVVELAPLSSNPSYSSASSGFPSSLSSQLSPLLSL